MKSHNTHPKTGQRGAATLLISLVLLIAMTLVTLTTTRSGMMEQQIVANDIRAREAQEAAEAGLEYGIAWASENDIDWTTGTTVDGITTITCPGATDCPTLATVNGTTSSDSYNYTLIFTQGTDSIQLQSVSQGLIENTISATSEAFIEQISKKLFDDDPGTTVPEPWVVAGCVTQAPTGTPDTFVLDPSNNSVASGTSSSASCLPQGNLDVTEWNDTNGNGIKDAGENVGGTTYNRGSFSGCPSTNCAWNYAFEMSLSNTDAGHVYTNNIPCGASGSPAIYIVNNGGPINGADISGSCSGTGVDSSTIGAPDKPVLLIIPTASGCPKFNGGVTVYGIVYYETPTACSANGWGGATIYGSVIWEGDVKKPNANSQFIEKDYGNGDGLNDTFQLGVEDATRLPGTWKDF